MARLTSSCNRPDAVCAGFYQNTLAHKSSFLCYAASSCVAFVAASAKSTVSPSKEISRFDYALAAGVLHADSNLRAGAPLDAADFRPQEDLDSFVMKQLQERRPDIGVLASGGPRSHLDDRHTRAEPPHRLRQFKSDVAAS